MKKNVQDCAYYIKTSIQILIQYNEAMIYKIEVSLSSHLIIYFELKR